ncbi:WD40 repeat-like protein [Schizophyllum commune H4-8]|uniref:WD40 repeat-like protein n=1 Tax=Schizophyllum commune (strain H4-8 / FGSC 9210) TaxID=578458 RepID=UPI00215E3BBF|nr:WD40 repeat-like protein [Schizophyllum commune H4-8]KAI5890007.1 WD40 repeat-like protein [Schizophyllum commune H4-8]
MSNFSNTTFAKRLKLSRSDASERAPLGNSTASATNTPKKDSFSTPALEPAFQPETPKTPGPSTSKDYGDRFISSREADDFGLFYNLMEDEENRKPKPKLKKRHSFIPADSDARKEQARSIFDSVLHTEALAELSPSTSSPKSYSPATARRRTNLLAYATPSRDSVHRRPEGENALDVPDSYFASPIGAATHAILQAPHPNVRQISKAPYRVLSAPDLEDDFYLNLLDWSARNIIAVALGSTVYVCSGNSFEAKRVFDAHTHKPHDLVTSLRWDQRGTTLSVGTESGRLYLFDAVKLTMIRMYTGAHEYKIGCLAWNGDLLSSGSRDRQIHHRDVRQDNRGPVHISTGHKQEVCGIQWSNGASTSADLALGNLGGVDGLLASGGNDNKVIIWDLRGSQRPRTRVRSIGDNDVTIGNVARGIVDRSLEDLTTFGSSTSSISDAASSDYLFKFHSHTAAVKALAWDPHERGILASGGGSNDQSIRWWNCTTGDLLQTVDTGCQVCGLVYSPTTREIVSTHRCAYRGGPNPICVWKYPSLEMIANLPGHIERPLYLSMSPDGQSIVTGAGGRDQTLRFWLVFPRTSGEKRKLEDESRLDYARQLR